MEKIFARRLFFPAGRAAAPRLMGALQYGRLAGGPVGRMRFFMPREKTDRRVQLTYGLLRRAFMTLLSEKPLQEISIKELCDLAGVNRSTFYAHYTDLEELLHRIEDEMYEEFCGALDTLYQPSEGGLEPAVVTAGVFQCLKDNSDLCVVTLGPHGDKAFALRLLQRGREYCFQNYARYFKGATRQQVDYCYAFVSSGCIGMLSRWLEDGMQMPPAELARMAEGVIQYGYGYLIRGEEELTAPAGDAAPAGEKNFKT